MTWSVSVWRDGVQVTDRVPCSDWFAGEVGAGLVASMFGGPVSLARAVIEQRAAEAAETAPLHLFDDVEPITDDEWRLFAEGAGFEP